jgi:hypothetical protein
MQHPRIARHLGVVLYAHLTLGLVAPAFAKGGETLVSVGSPASRFSQNKQNEPAVAVDANHPNVVAAGANDNIDMEACNAGDPTTCPFTQGVGTSGVYFSFDSGQTWTQPTYTGWTARDCLGPAECTPHVGPIGTLPKYLESGLVSNGDPAVAFGPRPGPNGFSWDNGSRLYYANLTSNLSAERGEQAFRGFEAVAVSRIDGDPELTPEIVADQNNWLPPVIASQRQSATTFSDKEQIWADNAESSPFFGNVYVCFAQFRGSVGAAAPLTVIRSIDGGDTWEQKQVTLRTTSRRRCGGSPAAPSAPIASAWFMYSTRSSSPPSGSYLRTARTCWSSRSTAGGASQGHGSSFGSPIRASLSIL